MDRFVDKPNPKLPTREDVRRNFLPQEHVDFDDWLNSYTEYTPDQTGGRPRPGCSYIPENYPSTAPSYERRDAPGNHGTARRPYVLVYDTPSSYPNAGRNSLHVSGGSHRDHHQQSQAGLDTEPSYAEDDFRPNPVAPIKKRKKFRHSRSTAHPSCDPSESSTASFPAEVDPAGYEACSEFQSEGELTDLLEPSRQLDQRPQHSYPGERVIIQGFSSGSQRKDDEVEYGPARPVLKIRNRVERSR